MPYFDHDGLSFYYIDSGHGSPFIFQHGLGGNVDQIEKMYTPPPGVRLISFDFRGHGKTPMGMKTNLRFNTFADDVSALMDHLHLGDAIIGGVSMGAAVALNFTLRNSNRVLGLVLSRPAWLDGPMPAENKKIYGFLARVLREHGQEKGRQVFMSSDLFIELSNLFPITAQSFLAQFNYEKAVETAAKFECLPEDAPGRNRDEWKKLTMATLVLVNKLDPVHPFEYGLEYAMALGQAELKEITPKPVNEEQHNKDVQKNIDLFINQLLKRDHLS